MRFFQGPRIQYVGQASRTDAGVHGFGNVIAFDIAFDDADKGEEC